MARLFSKESWSKEREWGAKETKKEGSSEFKSLIPFKLLGEATG